MHSAVELHFGSWRPVRYSPVRSSLMATQSKIVLAPSSQLSACFTFLFSMLVTNCLKGGVHLRICSKPVATACWQGACKQFRRQPWPLSRMTTAVTRRQHLPRFVRAVKGLADGGLITAWDLFYFWHRDPEEKQSCFWVLAVVQQEGKHATPLVDWNTRIFLTDLSLWLCTLVTDFSSRRWINVQDKDEIMKAS